MRKKYSETEHFKERSKLRDVSKESAQKCANEGRVLWENEGLTCKELNGIETVVDETERTLVTTYGKVIKSSKFMDKKTATAIKEKIQDSSKTKPKENILEFKRPLLQDPDKEIGELEFDEYMNSDKKKAS